MAKQDEKLIIQAAIRVCSLLGLDSAFRPAPGISGADNGASLGTTFDATSIQLIKMYAELMRITGKEATAREWIHAHNDHLGGVPAELIKETTGIADVLEYLQACP
jgi:hypothetical protein